MSSSTKTGRKLRKRFKKELPFHLMLLPAVLMVVLFKYIPMAGLSIAFQDYSPLYSIFEQEWCGWENFKYIFSLSTFPRVIYNTLFIAIMKIAAGIIVPVTVALLLNEVRNIVYKRTLQTIVYLPHFISWVALAGIFLDVLGMDGIVNNFLAAIGLHRVYFLGNEKVFPFTMVVTDTWKTFGWNGNGVDDTWGLGVCNEMSDYAGYGTIEGVVNAFGGSILQYMWMPNDDGTVSYEPTSQETRNALEKLAAMYSEGLINEEFGVSDTDAISEAVAAGTCGLFYGTDGISWGAGRDAIANNNDCGWMVINAPSVEGGDATAYSYTNFDYVYAVNANCEHPEALIKLINFNNDRINSPDATLDSLEVWGVNSKTGINQCDYTYALLDPYLNKAIGYNTTIGQVFAGELKPEELMPEAYRYYVGIKRYVDEGYDKTGSANPDDLTAFQYAMCWGPKFGSWTRYSELRDAGMKMSVYTGAPTKTMMKRWSTLLALQDETFVKIISGSLDIEAFDDFVTQWNEQGGSTIQEEIAEMYMK